MSDKKSESPKEPVIESQTTSASQPIIEREPSRVTVVRPFSAIDHVNETSLNSDLFKDEISSVDEII
jgi:hypothetical protein